MADEKVAEKAKYYEWLDLSPEERSSANMPLTQDEYGKANKVSRPTLIKWREKRGTGENFNAQEYMATHLEKILAKTIKIIEEKGSAKHIEMALKLMGLLIERKQETVKIELTTNDRIRAAIELRDDLISEYRDTGVCPCCHKRKDVHVGVLLAERREQQPEDSVATVALSS